jgi:hypothetical protein
MALSAADASPVTNRFSIEVDDVLYTQDSTNLTVTAALRAQCQSPRNVISVEGRVFTGPLHSEISIC